MTRSPSIVLSQGFNRHEFGVIFGVNMESREKMSIFSTDFPGVTPIRGYRQDFTDNYSLRHTRFGDQCAQSRYFLSRLLKEHKATGYRFDFRKFRTCLHVIILAGQERYTLVEQNFIRRTFKNFVKCTTEIDSVWFTSLLCHTWDICKSFLVGCVRFCCAANCT